MKNMILVPTVILFNSYYSQSKPEPCNLVLSSMNDKKILYYDLIKINKLYFIDTTCKCKVISNESIFTKGNSVISTFNNGSLFYEILLKNVKSKEMLRIIFNVKIKRNDGFEYIDTFVLKLK